MNRCVCGVQVRYYGGRVPRDPVTDEPHECIIPDPPRDLLCACGAIVAVLPDGRRLGVDGRAHAHYDTYYEPPPWDYMEQAPIDDAPHPATTEQPHAPRRGSPMPARPQGEYTFAIEIVETTEE